MKLSRSRTFAKDKARTRDFSDLDGSTSPKKAGMQDFGGAVNMLDPIPLFSEFQSLKYALTKYITLQSYSAGEEITSQGNDAQLALLIFRSGIASVSVSDTEVAQRKEGEMAGLPQLLGIDDTWTETLVATSQCQVCRLTRSSFLRTLENFPEESAFFKAVTMKNRDVMLDGTVRNTCDIFRSFSETTTYAMHSNMSRSIFFPGEYITVEGEMGDELYILVNGMVTIEIGGLHVRQERRGDKPFGARLPLNRIPPEAAEPVCFGELGLLGIQPMRAKSVVAESVCQVRVLHRQVFLQVLSQSNENLQMSSLSSMLEVTDVPAVQHLKEVAIFKEVHCAPEFLDYLAKHLEYRVILSGQVICEQNATTDRSMYILSRGRAKVLKNGDQVATLTGGEAFGELMILGLVVKRTVTVVAEEICFVQCLNQSVVINGLKIFPSERRKMMMIAFQRSHGTGDAAKDWTQSALRLVIKAMAASPVFGNLNEEFIRELGKVAKDRVFMPGDLIIEQGSSSKSLFIMISGQASVYTSSQNTDEEDAPNPTNCQKLGELTAGSITGEMAMLGVAQQRSASIEALTMCCLWEIDYDSAMPLVNRFKDVQQLFADVIKKNLMHTVPTRIEGLALFDDFSNKLRMLLSLYSDRVVYFRDQAIFKEGATGVGLCIINMGKAALSRKDLAVGEYETGSYFNVTSMTGSHKCSFCTLTAMDMCHCVIITHTSYYLALSQFPAQKQAKALEKNEYKTAELFRKNINRLLTQKMLQERCAESNDSCDILGSIGSLSNAELKSLAFQAWEELAKCWVRRRQVAKQQGITTDEWVRRRKRAISKRRDNDLVRALVRQQLTGVEAAKAQKLLPKTFAAEPLQEDNSCKMRNRLAMVSSAYEHPHPVRRCFMIPGGMISDPLASESPYSSMRTLPEYKPYTPRTVPGTPRLPPCGNTSRPATHGNHC